MCCLTQSFHSASSAPPMCCSTHCNANALTADQKTIYPGEGNKDTACNRQSCGVTIPPQLFPFTKT